MKVAKEEIKMVQYKFPLTQKSNPEVKNAILSALAFRNERKNKARIYCRGSHLRPGPKCQNMVDHLVKFDEEQVINALKELYNDGKIRFCQQGPNLERLFFHLELSIRLVEDGEELEDERLRFHFGQEAYFGQGDPGSAFRFMYSNLDSDSNFSWSTITDISEKPKMSKSKPTKTARMNPVGIRAPRFRMNPKSVQNQATKNGMKKNTKETGN